MRTAVWIHFVALAILSTTASITAQWFGRIIHKLYNGPNGPWPTETLISYHWLLYLLPEPSLIMACWFSVKGGLEQSRVSIIGAYTFLVAVVMVSITVLPLITPFLPWGIVLEPAK